MQEVENDIKNRFSNLREDGNREIYFYNSHFFNDYIGFIKAHKLFIKEVFIKPIDKKQVVKIVKRTTPTLKERGLTQKSLLQRAQRVDNDEFYTRYEDIQKELSMYDKGIWQDKVVFCNCDDAVGDSDNNTSAFALYFIKNFNILGLKKLICTHHSGQLDLFNQGAKGYIFTKDGFRQTQAKEKSRQGMFDNISNAIDSIWD
jgi:hypothetical protein